MVEGLQCQQGPPAPRQNVSIDESGFGSQDDPGGLFHVRVDLAGEAERTFDSELEQASCHLPA